LDYLKSNVRKWHTLIIIKETPLVGVNKVSKIADFLTAIMSLRPGFLGFLSTNFLSKTNTQKGKNCDLKKSSFTKL
jgi:hypothetical protein